MKTAVYCRLLVGNFRLLGRKGTSTGFKTITNGPYKIHVTIGGGPSTPEDPATEAATGVASTKLNRSNCI